MGGGYVRGEQTKALCGTIAQPLDENGGLILGHAAASYVED